MKSFFTILFLFFYLYCSAQITYTKTPLDLQLIARDKITNLGIVTIEGIVDIASDYESLRMETYRNDLLINTNDLALVYINTKASFVFDTSIPAELANYSFKIYGYRFSSDFYELDKTISNVVAGDTYIIQGQSNAVASKRIGSANTYKSDFIRVYANGTDNFESLLSNDAWYIGNGDVFCTSNGNTGQWGLKLAKLLIDKIGIPIAVFNGAYPGKAISFFKAPKDYISSQNSNYGRLYYRLNKSGLKNNVRAVLWSQGETDGGLGTSINNYINSFTSIKNSWLIDYPNIEKIYIFQTKDCNTTSTDREMNIKEAQRLLTISNNQIDIISTTSIPLLIDSCHFPFVNGYEEFTNRVYKLVLQDLYGKSFTEEIKCPMIKSAEFSEPNTLVLETDAKELKFSSTDQTTMLTRLKQDFELRNAQNAIIENVKLEDNKIIFTLSNDPGPISNISFVGNNSNIGYTITNSADLELISFRNFLIKNLTYNNGDNSSFPIIDNTSICNTSGSLATISVNSPNIDTSYRWLFKVTSGEWTEITNLNATTVYSNYNSPVLEIKKSSVSPVSGTLYRVVATNNTQEEFTSNEAVLTIDLPPVSKTISEASAICFGEDKTLSYNLGSFESIQWQYSTTSNLVNFIDIYEATFSTYTENNLQQTTWYRVENSNGVCPTIYSPAIKISVYSTPTPTGNTTQTFNFNNPVYISNLVVSGNNIKWYSTNSDALTNTNTLQLTDRLTIGNTYYATQSLNQCNSTTPLKVTVTNSLHTNAFNFSKLEFYPNPFTNYFKLKYPEIITSIELFNNLGQSVLKTNPNDKETTLNVNHLPSGIYFMEVSSKKNKGIIKGIKL